MKIFFKIIKLCFKHRCKFSTPVISQYVSFNQRNIIYKCDCGKKQAFKIYRPFGVAFDIETTPFLTNKEFNEILNN